MKLALIMFFIVAVLSGYSFAHSVTMNLAFHISPDKSDTIATESGEFLGTDVIDAAYDSSYIGAYDGNAIFGLYAYPRGKVTARTVYSANDYMISLKRDDASIFAIAAANNAAALKEKSDSGIVLPLATFGSYASRKQDLFTYYIVLQHPEIFIAGSLKIGKSSELLVKNTGGYAIEITDVGEG